MITIKCLDVHKKCLRLFNEENLYMLDYAQNRKTISNCQATYQKKLYFLFEKIRQCFSPSEHTDRLDNPSPVRFCLLFNDLPSPPPLPQ